MMKPHRVGIIGFPLSHTLSPAMHNAAFEALGLVDWEYTAMSIPPDIPRHAVEEPRRHGFIGLNVTIPFKEAVMSYVRPDEKARAIGAVNTIDFRTNTGTNTDVDGFIQDLHAHDVPLLGQRVLVLGAGGAARAAVYGLWQQGAMLGVVNRTTQRAHEMLTHLTLAGGVQGVEVLALQDAPAWQPDLIVNCTSVGLYPQVDASPWEDAVPFPQGVAVYDMIYRPRVTRFMQQAQAAGGRTIDGLGMLVRQGALAFELWTGQPAPIDVMFATVESAL